VCTGCKYHAKHSMLGHCGVIAAVCIPALPRKLVVLLFIRIDWNFHSPVHPAYRWQLYQHIQVLCVIIYRPFHVTLTYNLEHPGTSNELLRLSCCPYIKHLIYVKFRAQRIDSGTLSIFHSSIHPCTTSDIFTAFFFLASIVSCSSPPSHCMLTAHNGEH